MSIIGRAVRAGVVVKLAQVARRELSKPENQQKIKDAVRQLQTSLRKPR